MTVFDSVHSYHHFASSVRSEWRYSRTPEQAKFLEALADTSKEREETIPKGTLLFRAQLGCDWPRTAEEQERDPGPRPFDVRRMLPRRDRVQEGRVNPRGIPCLYAATKEFTAAAEVRPWIGAYVSVAQLRVKRNLRLINATSDDRRVMVYFTEPSPDERERAVWKDIDRAFSRPVERDEHSTDYVPTQVIAEMFRERGLDGIGYRSTLGPGHNVAIFDLDSVDLLNCTVYHLRNIQFAFDEAANRYFVTKQYNFDSDA